MNTPRWSPSVTVAAIIEQHGRYLLVEEHTPEGLRLAYCGTVGEEQAGRTLDDGIVRTLWLTFEEAAAEAPRMRSPQVLQCLADHRAGRRLPLDAVTASPTLGLPEVKQ